MQDPNDFPSPEDALEQFGKYDKAAKHEAERITKLFNKVFDNDHGEEVLKILSNRFDLHLPSMPAQDFDQLRSAYMDGQKSMLIEIEDIKKGKLIDECTK